MRTIVAWVLLLLPAPAVAQELTLEDLQAYFTSEHFKTVASPTLFVDFRGERHYYELKTLGATLEGCRFMIKTQSKVKQVNLAKFQSLELLYPIRAVVDESVGGQTAYYVRASGKALEAVFLLDAQDNMTKRVGVEDKALIVLPVTTREHATRIANALQLAAMFCQRGDRI